MRISRGPLGASRSSDRHCSREKLIVSDWENAGKLEENLQEEFSAASDGGSTAAAATAAEATAMRMVGWRRRL
jgi:hypothetical protein